MTPETIRTVRERAAGCCEYCWLPAASQFLPFQVDHVIAKKHGAAEHLDNLAFACVHCNRHKGPNIAGIDPETESVIRLFNPRCDRWTDHFQWAGSRIEPVSAIGRVTVAVLFLNNPEVLLLRDSLARERTRS